MTDSSSDRLDRIEALLQQSVIASNERMTRLEQATLATDKRLEQLAVRVEETTTSVNNLSATVNQLSATVNQLSERMDQLSERMDQLATEAREDRVVMHEVIDQLVTVRDENKEILNYLFGQQRNGNGDQPQQ